MEKEVQELTLSLGVELLTFEEGLSNGDVFEFVPKRIDLKDSSDLTKKETRELLTNEASYKINEFANTSYGIIQALQDFTFSTYPQENISQEDFALIDKHNLKYTKIKELITKFLGTDIGRSIYGETTIFGRPFQDANLSEGQRILLQLCVALLEKEIAVENAILILDEPENHLHPSVLIEIIEKILTVNTSGQLWIATHSIPLIAHFDPHFLWHCENGEIAYAGRNPEKIIDSLIGDEEKLRLTEFMNLPAQFASTKFAIECLMPAPIVDTGIGDPQTNQIKKIITDIGIQKKILRILDFGAGKGRLLKLFNLEKGKNIDLYKLDYYGFDLPSVFNEITESCLHEIKSFYNEAVPRSRYFTSIEQMSSLNEGSFDVIVLCNVLHEIEPTEWVYLFSEENILGKYLNKNGYILIVEDQEMPVGEKAYKNGFMVFGKNQFRKLFNLKEKDNYESFDARGDNRLMAHLIPKKYIQRITNESIKTAIEDLSSEALRKIDSIRQTQNCNFKNGMKLSFWLQQYANSNLNLRPFSKKK